MIEFELALWLTPVFFAGALLYATVGHGGASACPAIMALALAAGGWLGAKIGSRRIQPARLLKTRALVLASAGSKLAFI